MLIEDIERGDILVVPFLTAARALGRSGQALRRWSRDGKFIPLIKDPGGNIGVDAKQFLEFYKKLQRVPYAGADASTNDFELMQKARDAKKRNGLKPIRYKHLRKGEK